MNLQGAKDDTENIIKWEDEDAPVDMDQENSELFAQLLEEEMAGSKIHEGRIIKGKVIEITSDYVVVDVEHKTDGRIPKEEFLVGGQECSVKEGDEIDVYLDSFEDNHGEMILSKERADILQAWDRIETSYEKNEVIKGSVMARVKGGLSVDIGVKAFLPGSQVDLRPMRNPDKLIGETLDFKIIKFSKKRGNIVLSRRVLLEQAREKQRTSTLDNLTEGTVFKGVVKNITDYGAFVDLGGIDGLLHITDMSWGRINHPSQLFEVGQDIEVNVLSYNPEKQRVSLGYKQLQKDPWEKISQRYVVDTKTQGKIVSLTDYGAFLELEPGVEGLIHVSEMSWSKRVRHPSKLVKMGDVVDVVVLALDAENRRISLGMKQIEPNPWAAVKEKYKVGSVISCVVRNITDFGLFVGVEDDIDGLVHISDISWIEKINHPSDRYKKGDTIDAIILQVDPELEKFSLGIKQMEKEPWLIIAEKFPVQTKGKGKVTKVTDFGLFVDMGQGIEGMIHVSELDVDDSIRPEELVKVGGEVDFVVVAIDVDDRKISLSRKVHMKQLEGEALKQYLETIQKPKTTLADAFNKAKEKTTGSSTSS